jgi:hypothetical protein
LKVKSTNGEVETVDMETLQNLKNRPKYFIDVQAKHGKVN